ncbi:PhnD/SsuA/transferrin family substrate-binding protein [Myxococcota bacterium]|nr:PhnD/SsuA/transferrin family substrate-binding protein [Myxococcota bacterium]MBU1432190.1 PhnD/SsuA/transferrin family substrate-binding protein [Myxococcota bacterium]MBU1899579.1 PhnD/SsuA/transferrin family substrate-binding protein [Myxococcota bacterium]
MFISLPVLYCALFCVWTSPPLRFGVHPYLPRAELEARFTPLAQHLAAELQRPVQLQIASSYEQHIKFIGEDQLDLAFIGPAALVLLFQRYGTKPLLARLEVNGAPNLRGVIFTLKDRNDLTSIDQIKGHSVAFGSQRSTMSYIVPIYILYERGITLQSLSHYAFLDGHTNVVHGVLMGDFDVGAVKLEVFKKYSHLLKMLEIMPEVSEHAFITSNKTSDELNLKIKNILLGLSPKNSLILSKINPEITDLVETSHADYEKLEQMIIYLSKLGII